MTPSLVDVISDFAEKLVITNASTVKRLTHDTVILNEACDAIPNTLSSEFKEILDSDQRPIKTLVSDFASDATQALLVLHEAFQRSSQNLPTGSSVDVDRLMLENVTLMQSIWDTYKTI